MRYTFYYLLSVLGELPGDAEKRLRGYLRVGNLHYQFTSYEQSLATAISQQFSEIIDDNPENFKTRSAKRLDGNNSVVPEGQRMKVDLVKISREGRTWNDVSIIKRSDLHSRKGILALKSKRKIPRINKNPRKKNLLIINTGHWSLRYRTLISHLMDLHKVAFSLKKIISKYKENTRVIFFTSVPFNFFEAQSNSFAVMAANFYLSQRLFKNTSVEIFDQFSLIYPLLNHQVCHSHYLCLNITGSQHKMYGSVGKQVVNYFLKSMLHC